MCEFEIGDGKQRRGFVGLKTWSFINDAGIKDDDLYAAYIGWNILVGLDKPSNWQYESDVLDRVKAMNVTVEEVRDRYMIGDSEVYSINGIFEGKKIKLAIDNDGARLYVVEGMPEYQLPPEYMLIGKTMIS